ncbi:MAG: hypothetical protein M3P34_09585 [Actinomycetota bacterium]|nr:hypothetical protein [Actinomycetota bacterium]
MFDVNAVAPLALAAAALPLLGKAQNTGRILNITSVAGVEAYLARWGRPI